MSDYNDDVGCEMGSLMGIT